MNEQTRAAIAEHARRLADNSPPLTAEQARLVLGIFARGSQPVGGECQVNRDEHEQLVAEQRWQSEQIRAERCERALADLEAINERLGASPPTPTAERRPRRDSKAGTTPLGGGS